MPFGIDDAYLRSGEELDRIAIANRGHFDTQMRGDLADIVDAYNDAGRPFNQTFEDLHTELWQIAGDDQEFEEPTIPGRFYPELRVKFQEAARTAGSDPHLVKALRDTGDALDRMFSRSISPEHGEAWQNALIARRNAQARMSNPLGAEQAPAADTASPPQWPDASDETAGFGLPPVETVATPAPAQPFGLPPRRPGRRRPL